MATDTLMFDLLAKDSASGAFKDLARSATVAAGEMHAAFADPVTAKIKTEGFDSYMAKLAEVKAANDLAIGDIQAKTMKLTEGADAAGRELDAMAAKLDGAGNSADRNGGKFRGLLNTLSMFGKGAGGISGGGMLAGLGGAVGAGSLLAIGGLASALTAAAGAGGILGLAVVGDVKHFMALKQQIDAAQKSLDGATPGTKAYADAQAKLNGLLKTQRQEYGPMMAGVDAISKAWSGFLDKTRGPVMRLMGEGLTVAADALKQFAPVANAAAKALMPLLRQMDDWVKGSGFKQFLDYLKTTGASALSDFVHFLGEVGKGFLDLMVALAPAAQKIADFFGHLGSKGALTVLGVALAGVAAALTGISAPVALAVAGIVALGAAMIAAWKHSAQFRSVATKAMHGVMQAIGALVKAAQGFWHQWGDTIKKYGIAALELFVNQTGHQLAAVFHLIAAFLDLLSGNWKGAWSNIKSFAVNEIQSLLAPFAAVWNAIKGSVSSAMSAIGHAVSSGIHNVEAFFSSLPGKITGALAGLPGEMASIGANIIGSLADSIWQSAQSKLTSVLHDVTSLIPLHKGPPAKDRALLEPAGKAIMDGLINGLKSREAKLQQQLQRTTNQIQSAMAFGQAFAGNVFDAGLPTTRTRTITVPGHLSRQVVNGQTVITSTPATTRTVTSHLSNAQVLAEMFRYQRGQLHQDTRLEHQVAKLKREGLSSSLIAQMESAGTAGLAQIAALASASPSQVRRFNRLNAQTNTALANAGAQAVAGKSMAALRHQKAQEETIYRGVSKALKHAEIRVHGHGKLRVTG